MTDKQRHEALELRQRSGRPWHVPPHFGKDRNVYVLTGACYGHASILHTAARRKEWQESLLESLGKVDADIKAWVVLPNHWHALASVELPHLKPIMSRLHNGKSTQWNREDGAAGRKVWHGFADRRIRNQRHYWASLNYIHANPVKHGYVKNAADWRWSSLHRYLKEAGREALVELWREYPVADYGKGWDDF